MLVPKTIASPVVGWSTPARIRSSVVFPAPSGPTIPNSSPARTSKLTSSSALIAPKRRPRPRTETQATSLTPRPFRAHVRRHAWLQRVRRVAGDADPHRVDQLHPLLGRLHVARRELRLA